MPETAGLEELVRTMPWEGTHPQGTELLRLPNGRTLQIGGEERAGGVVELYGADYLVEFRLEAGLPVWVYRLDGYAFEKRVFLVHEQNTTYVNYRLVEGDGVVRLKLR